MVRKVLGLSSLVVSIVFVAACSSGSSGNGNGVIRPLSIDEKARLKTSVKSLGEVTGLANELGSSSHTSRPGRAGAGRPQFMARAAMEFFLANQPGSSAPGNASELKRVIDESQCTKTMKFPEDQPPLEAGETKIAVFSYDVSGPGCPLRFRASMSGEQFFDANHQPSGLKAVLKYEYQALTQEALEAADVDRIDMSGNMDIRSTADASGNQNMTFTMVFGGTGHSQKDGDFRVNDRFDGNIRIGMGTPSSGPSIQPPGGGGFPSFDIKGAMNETMLFAYKELAAQLESKIAINGFNQTADFRINGVQVQQTEYDDFRKALNIPGMNDDQSVPGPGPGPHPTNSLVCESRVYSRQAIDAAALQAMLNRNEEPTFAPIAQFSSCSAYGKHDEFSFPVGQHVFKFSYDYEINRYAQAQVDVCMSSDRANCARVKRAFMFDEKTAFADAAGEHTVMTRCEPKPSCF